jgi:HSP20 family protein
MAISQKTKGKIDDAGKEIKAAIDSLGKDVAELTKKVKEKFKGAGEDMKETAEELSREVKKLSERVKDIVPKRGKASQLPVRVGKQKYPALRSEDLGHPFLELQRATNRLFDDFFRDFGLFGSRWADPLSLTPDVFGDQWPRVDMSETDKEILITAELPGVNKDDLGISVSEGRITIHGEKKEQKEDKGKDYYRLERSYGSFQRSLSLPCEIDADKVDASFKDGVLKISLPKTEAARERIKKIPVKSA